MKKIIVMIPARMGSTRFPGKPIIDICGKTMIEHVWQRVKLNKNISDVYIATCDDEIREVAENFGADVIMTSDRHERCTDRIAEACQILVSRKVEFNIVLNIQGDEPLLNPDTIVSKDWLDNLIYHFNDSSVGAVGPISNYVAGKQKMELYGKQNLLPNNSINEVAQYYYKNNKQKSSS